MWLVDYLLVPILFCGLVIGHFAIWVMAINRLHSTGLARPLMKSIDKLIYLFVFGLPALAIYSRLTAPSDLHEIKWFWIDVLLDFYFVYCLLIGLVVSAKWLLGCLRQSKIAAFV